jgi:hypothetical protein
MLSPTAKPEIPAPRLPDSGEGHSSNTASLSRPGRGEENDDYHPVIANLNARWRVIACKSSIQWVLQRRDGADHWRGYWFCRTREALIRGARGHAGDIAGDALVILLRLPAWFPEATAP